jgi:predicted peptidase
MEETIPSDLVPNYIRVNDNVPGFYSSVPRKYFTNSPSKNYPTIICFTGAGGFGSGGDDLSKVIQSVSKVVKSHKLPPVFSVNNGSFSFIVLAPQFEIYPTNDQVNSFIEYAREHYRIDESRLYLAGYSLGGRVASDFAANRPNVVAAVVTMGGCSTSESSITIEEKCEKMANANLPIWSFHNRYDEAWPVFDTERMISLMKLHNSALAVRMTIFEESEGNLNHDCWTRASNPDYKEDGLNIYEWLLTFHR